MWEPFVAAFLVAFAIAVAVAAMRSDVQNWRRLGLFAGASWGVLCVVLLTAAFANREPRQELPPAHLPLETTDDEYRSSDACRSCHAEEYETWHASYHRTMTQRVSPEAVLGNFNDTRVSFGGDHYVLFQQDGGFFGRIDARDPGDPTGPTQRRVVRLEQMTGSHHMQIYWYASGRGRSLVGFPLVYLLEQQRWVPRKAAFLTPPGPALHDIGNWNGVCIECHTTHPQPRIRDSRRRRSDSHVTELGIACEACHGPGGPHIDANGSPLRRFQLHFSEESDPTIVNPAELPHVRSSQVCGQCHSVKTAFDSDHFANWMENGSNFRPGEDLDKSAQIVSNAHLSSPGVAELVKHNPEFMRSTFWHGGSARVSGREYNGLLESPCFQRGEMSCVSCHKLHKAKQDPRELTEWANDQLGPEMDGNDACLQCHDRFAEEKTWLAHTNHASGSSGSECMNCHMPHTSYGLLKAIRSHQVDSPRVATDIDDGRPNACNLCHLDQSLEWTAEHLASWYGDTIPQMTKDQAEIAAGVRGVLEGDAGVRALTAWSMGWAAAQEASGTYWLVPYLAELMNDPYDAVRMVAARSIRTLPGFENVAFDELATSDQRAEAIREIQDRWARSNAELRRETIGEIQDRSARSNAALPRSSARDARTLLNSRGVVETTEFARLRERRDDRPVTLAE